MPTLQRSFCFWTAALPLWLGCALWTNLLWTQEPLAPAAGNDAPALQPVPPWHQFPAQESWNEHAPFFAEPSFIRQVGYIDDFTDATLQQPVAAAHQTPLARPEAPGEPAALAPIAEGFAFPEPSCLSCNGCGGCGVCGGCQICEPCVAHTRFGRFACGMVQAVCCPDPCYEPRWTGIANAAFWVDSARPVTHVRYRWDASLHMVYPDRAGFVWPRVGALGPAVAPQSLNLHELSMYNEVASGGFAFFINTPYRSYDTNLDAHAAGFGDLDIGTKSVLFDCELMQITFQFRTFMPVGIPTRGLGTGNVNLEPSILMALNISPRTYLQTQVSEWIPISPDSGAGAILHYHASLNHTLWHWQPSVPIIGTLEANGWSFQDGTFTDSTGLVHNASGETYLSAGPGIRVVICDKIDFGIGTAFAVTENHWGEQTVRSEFRWRF